METIVGSITELSFEISAKADNAPENIIVRRSAIWFTNENPVLGISQFGIETNTLKWKIGDGDTEWNDLPYEPTLVDIAASRLPRITAETSNTAPTPNVNTTDQHEVRALAGNATWGAPTGTPVDGQFLMNITKDNGTSRTLAYNPIYVAGTSLPFQTATTVGKRLFQGYRYHAIDVKWHLIAQIEI